VNQCRVRESYISGAGIRIEDAAAVAREDEAQVAAEIRSKV
jgi:hypothetical protein